MGQADLLAALLLHEELHDQRLLLLQLLADVLGDVWDQPVDEVAHQHHRVLLTTTCGYSTVVSASVIVFFLKEYRATNQLLSGD